MKINKIKELKIVYKLLICIVVTIISIVCMQILLNNWDNKIENFDYSKVYSVNGVITEIGWNYDGYVTDYTIKTSAYMKVQLENNEIIKIELGGSTAGYTEGQSVIIYTDGTHYSTTQEGIAADVTLTIFNLLGACVIIVLALAVWIYLLGWKGFFIGLFILIFIVLWGEE